ncbi:hypothetical protein Glove_327g29 [Diversispora epigaea]|uniref:Uncharacterized protein n=1 Tax=Diversispora epigaea TaxID=1348612 RepID=A0A397HL70_9GLOM|nr:hypothetical protein Glove_327g29 [Diversispora epigaea]
MLTLPAAAFQKYWYIKRKTRKDIGILKEKQEKNIEILKEKQEKDISVLKEKYEGLRNEFIAMMKGLVCYFPLKSILNEDQIVIPKMEMIKKKIDTNDHEKKMDTNDHEITSHNN